MFWTWIIPFFVELWEVVKHFKKYRKELISLKNDLELKAE